MFAANHIGILLSASFMRIHAVWKNKNFPVNLLTTDVYGADHHVLRLASQRYRQSSRTLIPRYTSRAAEADGKLAGDS